MATTAQTAVLFLDTASARGVGTVVYDAIRTHTRSRNTCFVKSGRLPVHLGLDGTTPTQSSEALSGGRSRSARPDPYLHRNSVPRYSLGNSSSKHLSSSSLLTKKRGGGDFRSFCNVVCGLKLWRVAGQSGPLGRGHRGSAGAAARHANDDTSCTRSCGAASRPSRRAQGRETAAGRHTHAHLLSIASALQRSAIGDTLRCARLPRLHPSSSHAAICVSARVVPIASMAARSLRWLKRTACTAELQWAAAAKLSLALSAHASTLLWTL